MSLEQQSFRGEYQGTAESHYIDTPEQVELRFNVAGIGSRFVAVLVDSLIMGFCFFIEILLFVWIAAAAPESARNGSLDTAGKWFLAFVIFANFAFFWGYFALFEAFWNGQTPGKRVMKIRVIKDAGRQITFFEALARNLLRFVDYMPGAYLVGVITMLCNKGHKRLGDFAAGTIVVHERIDEQPLIVNQSSFQPTSIFQAASPAQAALEPWKVNAPQLIEPGAESRAIGSGPFPADAVAKLSAQDLVMIESFFARALDLTIELRATMAMKIARQITAKMGVALPEGNPERALEAIAYAMRGSGSRRW
jgi:uncharacterized RDD family membrane protein YckC